MDLKPITIEGNVYQPKMLKEVKKGEFIVRKAGAKNVYMKDDYNRFDKKFMLKAWEFGEDINLKGTTIVYIGFTY